MMHRPMKRKDRPVTLSEDPVNVRRDAFPLREASMSLLGGPLSRKDPWLPLRDGSFAFRDPSRPLEDASLAVRSVLLGFSGALHEPLAVRFSKNTSKNLPPTRGLNQRGHKSRALCPAACVPRTGKEVIVMSNSTGKNSQAAQMKQLISGTMKHYPNASTELQVGGATFTVTSLTQLMQDFVNTREAVETSKAATRAKVETERNQAPSQIAVATAFTRIVRGTFGSSADALADFGLAPPKARTPMTAEAKAIAVAKREATRKARGTMGKNQKKGIKGNVTASLVVTPASGSTSVATPASPTGNAPTGTATTHAS